MMFSSNQVFEISGSLEQLEVAIEFAMSYSGKKERFARRERPSKCVYQITADGRYCIGWALHEENTPDGWLEYPFDYDAKIISGIVRQYIEKAPTPFNEFDGYDGTSKIGFLLQAGPGGDSYEERDMVKENFYCIANIRPYWCYYAK